MQNPSFPRQLLFAFLILAVLGVGVYQGILYFKVQPAYKPKQRPVPVVEVQQVKPQTVSITVESQGTVEAYRSIRLIAEVTGRVTSVSHRLQNGTLVEEDELLLTIDDTDYEAGVAQAKAELLSAQLNHKDRKARYQAESLTVKQAAAQVDAAEKQLLRAKKDLSNTQVMAPFAGAIRNKSVDVGQFVTAGSVLFELTGTERAEVRLPIHGSDISLLYAVADSNQLDLPALLTARVGSEVLTWPARVSRIEAAVDDDTRVYYVVASIEKPYEFAQPLSLGLFVNAVIEAPPLQSAVVVPRTALHEDEREKHFVYVLDEESRLLQRQVEVARTESELVVIVGGIYQGDGVVITRLQQMYEGLKVSPQKKD